MLHRGPRGQGAERDAADGAAGRREDRRGHVVVTLGEATRASVCARSCMMRVFFFLLCV